MTELVNTSPETHHEPAPPRRGMQHLTRPGFIRAAWTTPLFWAKAHSSATSALEEVHTTPPLRPQNALMSALEFM